MSFYEVRTAHSANVQCVDTKTARLNRAVGTAPSGRSSRPRPPPGDRKEDSGRGFPVNPRSLTSRAESGSALPHNAPSSTGPGGAASSLCATAPPASQRLHGNRTQTTYPGRLLLSQVTAGQSRGAGQGARWEWPQERGLLARS